MASETFWGLVDAVAEAHPERVVLADDFGRSLTCAQLRDEGERTAAALSESGVGEGTVVSWQLPTTLETMVVMVALARLGAVQNPILPIWRESEVRFATEQLATEVLVVPGRWRGFDHIALAEAVAKERPLSVVVIDHEATVTDGLRLPVGDPALLPAAPSSGEDPRWIYYSSGTTAAPKGARHCDRSVIAGSAGVIGIVGASSSDVNPIAFPVSHIGGAAMLAASLRTGMRLVLFDSFDPATTPYRLAAHRPTLLGTATPFFVAFMAAQRAHGSEPLYPDLRGCVGGGAPITAELGRQVREVFSVNGVANSWGLTEFPVATSQTPEAAPDLLDRTVGRPVAGVSVRVVDESEREVNVGEEGELRLKGPQCFLGYVDGSLDAAAFDAEGWFRSGDRGRIDEQGNVVITGRIKDAIIRNAENISALEIENVLATHPAVADVAVIGVPDPRTGERVCAVVVAQPGGEVTLDALAEHCRRQGLSRHKSPERLELVEALPRNLTGKVLKNELRAQFG
ncbi:cyclohexanecarboxylate-CoA ligase [Mycobacterium intermedium]|uniref:Long-chain-fatty-acid--CoA ligase FadD13 n=1 Tax=Mycobacterium intermedium TaxID=28445 RepID=A0A1E3SDJ7_MYCIE|nr:AMP-binding protein [Mycobacterium intermedium]MCV6967905.1 AMP-binding protein [Mycobacterium intermedium]ODQ99647.1 cyclohexanecarboxylate-CoA ligase [Mycobacterium intermedium]OPE49601.1 cyclohexanecarboxylate-CoA ligase [Mycobacterium intermedium]ORB09516.1 cyclohexanecarboxylate-CoA ligase [Mycobacterium intermedium]